MIRTSTLLFSFLLYGIQLIAQITPAENTVLNYRLTGFTVPTQKKALSYQFEIAEGNIRNVDSFQKQIIISQKEQVNRTIITLPAWKHYYTWRVIAYDEQLKQTGKSPLHHFSTGSTPFADTGKYRLRIINTNAKGKDLLFFSDAVRGIYNLQGEMVWYLPQVIHEVDTTKPVRDFKLTSRGTITFIANTQAYEIDYDGNLLWKAPDDGSVAGDTTEQYHHEFVRLHNGHFLIAGNQKIRKMIPISIAKEYADNEAVKNENGQYYTDALFGTIIEYDSNKKVRWTWKAAKYMNDSLFFTQQMFSSGHIPGYHLNSFVFDEKQKCIYASFRDINKIVKIAYPSGEVLNIYDAVEQKNTDPLLKAQHNCMVNADGNLYLFNNNVSSAGKRDEKQIPASVMILKEPVEKNRDLQVIWQMNCPIDDNAPINARGGGSVYELKDKSMLVCMGTAGRVFMVNRDKEILWNAVNEHKNENRWLQLSNYRVYPAEDNTALETLLFHHK
jgi:hypothetical protein